MKAPVRIPALDLKKGPLPLGSGGNPLTRAPMTAEQAGGGPPIAPAIGGGGQVTPQDAKRARLQLEGDPMKGRALRDPKHPRHKAVLAERDRLLAIENGAGSNG